MEEMLKIMGGALGIVVPVIFITALLEGVDRAAFDAPKKRRMKAWVVAVIVLWTGSVWVLSLAGLIRYHDGDVFPRFVVALMMPVLIGVALLLSRDFTTILDHIPPSLFAGVQTFRLAGFAFLLVVRSRSLPVAFVSAGYGDIATGVLALGACVLLSRKARGAQAALWAFNATGLADLLNVAALLLLYYPIWSHAQPSSAAATEFSLVMIPALAAPIALLLHVYSIRQIARGIKAETGAGPLLHPRNANLGAETGSARPS